LLPLLILEMLPAESPISQRALAPFLHWARSQVLSMGAISILVAQRLHSLWA
jgi:hypothetical protein